MTVDNPFAHLSDDDLVAAHTQEGTNSFHLTEMLRRHKTESTVLGRRIWWLNLLLLIFTAAICVLTGGLVWTAVREPHDDRHAWVLWAIHPSDSTFLPVRGWRGPDECDRERLQKQTDQNKLGEGVENKQNLFFLCLPDTVDPRGPKGK